MPGDEFTLNINNPDDPKVLVVGNNPDKQNRYGAALGLYNSRIVQLINKKRQLKSSVVIDKLLTISMNISACNRGKTSITSDSRNVILPFLGGLLPIPLPNIYCYVPFVFTLVLELQ